MVIGESVGRLKELRARSEAFYEHENACRPAWSKPLPFYRGEWLAVMDQRAELLDQIRQLFGFEPQNVPAMASLRV